MLVHEKRPTLRSFVDFDLVTVPGCVVRDAHLGRAEIGRRLAVH